MFKRLLIANRGEIAARIIRTASRLGIETVLPFVPSDSASPNLELATITELIPPGGFLNPELMVEIGRKHECSAVHPGYGFLSESAEFSDLVTKGGMKFVGPTAHSMRLLGDKSQARALAEKLEIPISSGYDSTDLGGQTDEELFQAGIKIGFPLLIKSALGGGGRGMRKVLSKDELLESIQSARREATSGFGEAKLLLEKYFERGRHIEVQIVGDSSGAVRHLTERDCSLQRRYQKLIEESPAPGIDQKFKEKLFAYSIKLGKEAKLEGVSTVEFLVNPKSQSCIFLEVNTRLQVEHPVTEECLGIDLVEVQLRVASGEKLETILPKKFSKNASIEVRIVSEDAEFIPSTGTIFELKFPKNIRIEHALTEGTRISGEFDSLLAKIISVGKDRGAAIKNLSVALDNTLIRGIPTNIEFLKEILKDEEFIEGELSSDLVTKVSTKISEKFDINALGNAAVWAVRDSLKSEESLRLIGLKEAIVDYLVSCEGKEVAIKSSDIKPSSFRFIVLNDREVIVHNKLVTVQPIYPTPEPVTGGKKGDLIVRASLSGKVISVKCKEGQEVKTGQVLVILESMKMEHSFKAKADGIIKQIYVKEGEPVQAKSPMVELEDA